jgi:putative ABC transport system permease protein
MMDDLRYCARVLIKAPGTVLACVLSLGLGIGAPTAVFSFVQAIQFKALPVRDEATLLKVHETSATELCSGCSVGTSYSAFLDLRSRATTLESLDAYTEGRFVVSGGTGGPERISGALISAGAFRRVDPIVALRAE